jgi:hypothetical protein
VNSNPIAEVALARGDLISARRWADDVVSATAGWHLAAALTTRARIAIADGEPARAERDAHDALAHAAAVEAYQGVPDILECLGGLTGDAGSYPEAARLFGAAGAIRDRTGAVRFKIYDSGYDSRVAALRNAMGDEDFDAAWAEGAALSTDEAIAYAHAVEANANDLRAAGNRGPPPSVTSSDSSAKASPTTTLPQGFSSHRGPCKPTLPTSTPNSASPPACNLFKKLPATADRRQRRGPNNVGKGCPLD